MPNDRVIIALLTDFGLDDWYAGEMKGAILSRCPEAVVVDICHTVPPGDIRSGAFALLASYRTFPDKTVFCAVVDPGVGGNRKAIVMKAGPYLFCGPDNGILSWVGEREKKVDFYEIERQDLFRYPVSTTFHGRDIFAPIAAELASGLDPVSIGPLLTTWVKLEWPKVRFSDGKIIGEVIYIDRFGNAITSITAQQIPQESVQSISLCLPQKKCEFKYGTHFNDVPEGELVGYTGSAGFVEIATNGGNAKVRFSLYIGDSVIIS